MFCSLSLISGWEEKGAWRGQKHEPLLSCRDAPRACGTGKDYCGRAELLEMGHGLVLDCK